jgi:1-acyl-sn-glycerol-3-phosphate acyltransferase
MKTLFWFIAFWLYLLKTLIDAVKYKRLGKQGKIKEQKLFLHALTSKWARTMIKLTGSTVEVFGLENIPDENVLYVSNHQSNFDIPLILGYLPKLKGFIAKVELEKLPIVSSWMKRLGCIFLDRSNIRKSLLMLKEGIEKLKNGETLVVFPEGTRSKGTSMGEFKKGSLKLALKSGVPIVPVTIDGTYKLLEEKNRIRKGHVKITVHPPIFTDSLTLEETKEINQTIYDLIKQPLV